MLLVPHWPKIHQKLLSGICYIGQDLTILKTDSEFVQPSENWTSQMFNVFYLCIN